MKKWNAPKVEDLDVKMTENGSEASTTESDGAQYISGKGWVTNAYYDSTKYEKCTNPDGSFQGTVTAKKSSPES